MGYRSDVALGIVFADAAKLKDFALKVMAFQPQEVRGALVQYSASEDSDEFIFAFLEQWKWYDSYPDVQAHVALQDFAREHGAATAYIRVGEDDDDVERDFMEPSQVPADADPEQVNDLMNVLYESFEVVTQINRPQGGKPLEFN
jgi:hypothetical protein